MYRLNLLPGQSWDFTLSKENAASGDVVIKAMVRGSGVHHLNLRADNLTFPVDVKEVALKDDGIVAVEWHCRIAEQDSPWVAVVVPDGDITQRREIIGSAGSPGR
jgi:hypothetical protein